MTNTYTTGANDRLTSRIPQAAKTALDLGCATGKMAQELSMRGIRTDGVTYSQSEKNQAEKHCDNVWLFNLEEGIPADITDQYDIVILSHVLEHISNPTTLMRDLSRILSSNGVVLCAIPNMLFIYNRLKLLVGRIEYVERGLMDYTHIRWYTKKTILELFEEHGYFADSFYAEGNLPLGPIRKILPNRVSSKIDRMGINLAPSWFAWEYSFVFSRQNS